MRFAYADPPYLGQGVKHYGALHDAAADCDTLEWHQALIERLCDEFPDGWALSLHTPSLKTMLNLCPDDVRVGAWVEPYSSMQISAAADWYREAAEKAVYRYENWRPTPDRSGEADKTAKQGLAEGESGLPEGSSK